MIAVIKQMKTSNERGQLWVVPLWWARKKDTKNATSANAVYI